MLVISTIFLTCCFFQGGESYPVSPSCPAEVPCQNGGQLTCTYSCVGDGIQVNLGCICDCTDQFFGALCEWTKPCSDGGYDETTAATTTTAEITMTAISKPLVAATGYDLVVVNPDDGSHNILQTAARHIYSVGVDWIKERIFFSIGAQNTIYTTLLSGTETPSIVASPPGSQVFAVAVDPVNEFIFFTQYAEAYDTSYIPYVHRINYNGTQQMAVSGPLLTWASGIAVDPSTHTLYFQVYASTSTEGVYMCDYLTPVDCKEIIQNNEILRPLGIIFDAERELLFWSGIDDTLDLNLIYSYDVNSGTRTLLGNYTSDSLDIVFGGLAVRGNYLYMMDAGYYGHWSGTQCDADTQLPLFRMPVSGGTVEEFSDYIFESCYNGNPLA